MEKISGNINQAVRLAAVLSSVFLISCSVIKVKDEDLVKIRTNKTYDTAIQVQEIEEVKPTPETKQDSSAELNQSEAQVQHQREKTEPPAAKVQEEQQLKSEKTLKKTAGAEKPKTPAKSVKAATKKVAKTEDGKQAQKAPQREPAYEDPEGFQGRRPIVDPFVVGEKVTLALSYFAVTAGYLTMETLPFKKVNDQKSYHFRLAAKSNGFFSTFYKVDDLAETFVDFEKLIPYNYVIKMDQTKKVGENKAVFDWNTGKAYTWERQISKDRGKEEKNFEWDLQPFSQNVLSAASYIRTFQLTPGKTIHIKMAHRGKTLDMFTEVLRKEVLDTSVGDINTIVIKPKFEIDGVFKPVGDIFMWLTDDDQKLMVRIESKIRIGTIVASLEELVRGQKDK